MKETKKLDEILFETPNELKAYLQNYLKQINCMDEFELFAHQVNHYSGEFLHETNEYDKMKMVLKSGLKASHYGSVDGTLRYVGESTQPETVANVLNYDYHGYGQKGVNRYPTIVLAFPKDVNVNGEKVPYAISDYSVNNDDWNTRICKMLKEKSNMYPSVDSQYTPKCWADIVKGFSSFKPTDTMFAVYLDKDGKYHLLMPHTHWAENDVKAYAEHKKDLAKIIKSYDVDLDRAIIDEIDHYKRLVDSYYDDFD